VADGRGLGLEQERKVRGGDLRRRLVDDEHSGPSGLVGRRLTRRETSANGG
jgi:hypothetical protein